MPKTVCANQSDPSKFRAARQRKPAGREPTASLPENPAWFLIAGQPIERDMAKSIRDNPKKARGRPATGNSPMVGVRMHEEMQDLIKNWAAKQNDHPSLAAAVRRLVELGLKKKE